MASLTRSCGGNFTNTPLRQPDVLGARFLAETTAGHNAYSGGFQQLERVPARHVHLQPRVLHTHAARVLRRCVVSTNGKAQAKYQVPGSFPAAWADWMAACGSLTLGNAYLLSEKHW